MTVQTTGMRVIDIFDDGFEFEARVLHPAGERFILPPPGEIYLAQSLLAMLRAIRSVDFVKEETRSIWTTHTPKI